MMQEEDWRPMDGFPGYSVSSLGRVRNDQTGVVRKLGSRAGYPCVTLRHADGDEQVVNIHHAVARAFLGPRPCGLYVCHRDGKKSNNTLDNLRYATPTENVADREIHGNTAKGERNGLARLTATAVRDMRARHAGGETIYSLAAVFGVAETTASDAIHRRTWRHIRVDGTSAL